MQRKQAEKGEERVLPKAAMKEIQKIACFHSQRLLIKSSTLEEGLEMPSRCCTERKENSISLMERCCSGVKKSDKYV